MGQEQGVALSGILGTTRPDPAAELGPRDGTDNPVEILRHRGILLTGDRSGERLMTYRGGMGESMRS